MSSCRATNGKPPRKVTSESFGELLGGCLSAAAFGALVAAWGLAMLAGIAAAVAGAVVVVLRAMGAL